MNWLLSKLALPLVAPALLAGLLASTGGLGLTWLHLSQEKSANATLTADLAKSRQETAEQKTALADFHAQVEKDRADANERALALEKALQAQITDLTSKAQTADRARRTASENLLKVLHAYPVEQQATLSPGVTDALRRVRDLQTNADTSGASTADRSPNRTGISASPSQ